jgi:sugar phosphate isomerase/epimerase
MRLAVSNIAWPSGADAEAAAILQKHGVQGLEIAPTKIWPRPLEAAPGDVRAYRAWWEERGLPIVAFQALLFGRLDLTVFGEPSVRRQTLDYLDGIFALAEQLGAGPLVFGSPKNRQVGQRPTGEIEAIAREFFTELAQRAERHHVILCLEPNPPEYGCDFATCAADALTVVRRVGRPGFGLHLDAGAMTLSRDPIAETFASASSCWRHFHVSEPFLRPIGTGATAHAEFAAALRARGYDGWISIEMAEPREQGPWQDALDRALTVTRQQYGFARTI